MQKSVRKGPIKINGKQRRSGGAEMKSQPANNGGRPIICSDGRNRIRQDMLSNIPVFPVSRLVNAQRYYDYAHEQTSTSGSVSTYKYSANGMFDPDITGTGHQPMGFDQLMLFYNQTTVLRSRIHVTFCHETSTGTPMRCAVFLSPDTTALTSPFDIIENGLCVSEVVGPTYGAGRAAVVLDLECDVAKYFGRSKGDIVNDSQLHTTAAANPTEQLYFFVVSWNCANLTSATVGFDVILEYDSVYNEPRKLAAS